MTQDYGSRPPQGYSLGIDQRAMVTQRPSTTQPSYRTTTASAGAPVVTSLRLPRGYPTSSIMPKTSLLLDKKGHWVQPKSTLSTVAEQTAMRKTQPAMPVAEVVSYLDDSPRAADAESMAWVTKLQNLPYERPSNQMESENPYAQQYKRVPEQYIQRPQYAQPQQNAKGAPARVGNSFLTDMTQQQAANPYPAYPQQQQWGTGSVYSDASAMPQRKTSSRASSVKDYNFEYEAPELEHQQWGSGQHGKADSRSGGYGSQAPKEQIRAYGSYVSVPSKQQQQQQQAKGYGRQPAKGGSLLDNQVIARQPAQQQQYSAQQRPGSAQQQRRGVQQQQQQRPSSAGGARGGQHLFDQQRPQTAVYGQAVGQQRATYTPASEAGQPVYGYEQEYPQEQGYGMDARQPLPQSQGWEQGEQEEWGSQLYRDPQGWPVREVSPPRNPHYVATTRFMEQEAERQQQQEQQRWQEFEGMDQGPQEYVARSMNRQAWQEEGQQQQAQYGPSAQLRQSGNYPQPGQQYDQPYGSAGQGGQYSSTVPRAAARQAVQPPADQRQQQQQQRQRGSSSSGAVVSGSSGSYGSYPAGGYAQPSPAEAWQRQSVEKGVQVPAPRYGYMTPDELAPHTAPAPQRSYYFDPAKGLVPGNRQLTDADLVDLRDMNLGQHATPGSPHAKLVGSQWKFVYDRLSTEPVDGLDRLTGRDISRTQPWDTDFLGQHVVPGSPNAKLVGGRYRLVPNEVDGPALWTDYYGPLGGGQQLADYYGRKYYDGPLNLVPRT